MVEYPARRSPRLHGYDYGQTGGYFVTICTHQRVHLFGDVVDGDVVLTALGCIAESCWLEIPRHFPDVELDAFVVMPNHIHGIVVFVGTRHGVSLHETFSHPVSRSLSNVVRLYKSSVTTQIRKMTQTDDLRVWQGRFHDHIIRNEDDLDRIRTYIENNLSAWETDTENQ